MPLDDAVRAFIAAQPVARLATIDDAERPHVVPVCFALVEDRLYSVVDEKPKRSTRLQRLRNIEARPSATLLFDVYRDDWDELAWVMVRGSAQILEDGDEYDAALAALRERYPQYRAMALEGRPLICLVPGRVSSWGLRP